MSFSESLTIRILGDSSGLRQELDQVSSEIENLQSNLSSATGAVGGLQQSFGKLSAGLKPLQQLNAQLIQVRQQINSISQTPITLNVQPAINALQQLMRYAMIAAQQIQTILGTTGGGRTTPNIPLTPAGPPATGGGSPRAKLFAVGGLVTGPPGIDRVSTRLTAGEFVLSAPAVKTLGLSYLDSLNRQPEHTPVAAATSPTLAPVLHSPQRPISRVLNGSHSQTADQISTASSLASARLLNLHQFPATNQHRTDNHFGGITINVEESVDVNNLFRDLQSQGMSQRHRRG